MKLKQKQCGKKTSAYCLCFVIVFYLLPVTHADVVLHLPLDGNADDPASRIETTLYGGASTTDRFGNVNSALSFDGDRDRIVTAPAGLLGIGKELTINGDLLPT